MTDLDAELYIEGACNDPRCGIPGKPCRKTGEVFRAPRVTSWMAARSTDAEASAKATAAITDAMQMHLGPRRRKAA
jgi:hypothetical protein